MSIGHSLALVTLGIISTALWVSLYYKKDEAFNTKTKIKEYKDIKLTAIGMTVLTFLSWVLR